MTKATAVILAAGIGSRLKPLTDDRPKALVPVAGTPILGYSLEAMADAARTGSCDVAVVVGHRGEQIAAYVRERFPFVRIIWNHEYLRTNNMFSLTLAMTSVAPSSRLVFMNGDCLYAPEIIDRALADAGTRVFCDPSRDYSPESMKITAASGRVTGISKAVEPDASHAVSCDLYAVGSQDLPALRDILHEHLMRGELNAWTEVALDAAMRLGCIHFTPEPVDGYWYEIDNHEDLAAATAIVRAARADAHDHAHSL